MQDANNLDAIPKYHSSGPLPNIMSDDPVALREESLVRLQSLLDSIDGCQVTLIGDTILDRYGYGFANNLNFTALVIVRKIFQSD